MAHDSAPVAGYCPMGCGATLFLGSAGWVTCSDLECPVPDAVATLLEDPETEHIVQLGPTEFTIKHPLRERLDDALMSCELHAWLASRSGPPVKPGRYRVYWRDRQTPAEWETVASVDTEEGRDG
jgi:Family of unknown function (DUF6085)